MIQIPTQAKIFSIPVHMPTNNNIDICIGIFKRYGLNPYSGELFVFKNNEATQIGILSFDGHGLHWCIKRFSEGKITWVASEKEVDQISARDLQIMLWGGDPRKLDLPNMWRPIEKTPY